jgi:hypothetical protein
MPEVSYTQDSFSGGMNLVSLDTKIAANQFLAGLNIRTRFGYAEPIKEPISITENLNSSLARPIQGLYAFGNILIVFVAGEAWYKETEDDEWTQIAGFQLDASVSRIYACAVPAATTQYKRKNDAGGDSPDTGILFDASATAGSPVALVCQDGINQPWLIFPDGTTREAATYADWDKDNNREYVPIGLQMIYFGVSLFIVGPLGDKIYRSVSGRPLDFVIAVDNDGEKVADAEPLSFAVDSNSIKLISALNDNTLIVISAYSAYAVVPNNNKQLYNEPTFNQTFLFSAGTINQFCWADILGDFAFIDREGLKSFNAVQQTKFEGNISVFSLAVAKIFNSIVQADTACVGSFENYTFFSVKTSYAASSVVVWDNVNKIFTSIDFLTPRPIKQFASTYTSNRQRFFAATETDVYELYSTDSSTPKEAVIFTRAFDSRNSDEGASDGVYNIKSTGVRLIFEDSVEDGTLFLRELVNNNYAIEEDHERDILAPVTELTYPVTFPVMFTAKYSYFPIDITSKSPREGQKLAYVISWSGGARLTNFILRAETSKSKNSPQQQSRIFTQR